MAVIACPECRKSVSTSAGACPHCGFPRPASGWQDKDNRADDQSFQIDSANLPKGDRVDRVIAWWKRLSSPERMRIISASMILAYLAFLSLAFLPAQLHRDWMPDVLGLRILVILLVVSLFLWARWRFTWGRIGRR